MDLPITSRFARCAEGRDQEAQPADSRGGDRAVYVTMYIYIYVYIHRYRYTYTNISI